jgi:hypothetical protein
MDASTTAAGAAARFPGAFAAAQAATKDGATKYRQ